MKELYELDYFTRSTSYMNNVFIYEYDISKCNINMYYTLGYIDKDTYDYLYNAERMLRQTYIGKLEKDNNEMKKAYKEGLVEYRRQLFTTNNLQPQDILAIKKDAVYVINRQLRYTKFGLIEFKQKKMYTAFYQMKNLEFYFYYNKVTEEEWLDVKGINDNTLVIHQPYFLQLLRDIMFFAQTRDISETMLMLKDFYNEYVTLQLPVEYYREFNIDSLYKFKFRTQFGASFRADFVSEADKGMLDITYNIGILMQFQRILSSMYFSQFKR